MAKTESMMSPLKVDDGSVGDTLFRRSLKQLAKGRPRGAQKGGGNAGEFTQIIHALREQLDVKRREEEKLEKDIEDILNEANAGASEASRSFGLAVSRLNNRMLVVEADAKALAHSLASISKLADNISGKVSALDVAKSRVVECLQLAGDLRDLRVCGEGVEDALRSEDWESAAQHVHRFSALDKAVFHVGDSGNKEEQGESVKHSYEVLRGAAATLKEIFERKLDDAIENGDLASMQRFVKLFPLIGEHESGLSRYGKFLCREIEKVGDEHIKVMRAGGTDEKRTSVLYADTLFLFFEAVAQKIEASQPLVESAYGPDHLLSFIQTLQNECDKVTNMVLDAFVKRRKLEDKVRLVQAFAASNYDREKNQEKLDALELDTLLSEMTLMQCRAEIYWRFLKRRVGEAAAEKNHEKEKLEFEELDEELQKRAKEEQRKRKEGRARRLDQLLNHSALGQRMQELLGKYILMEHFYMTQTVEKALDMDTKEVGALVSSVVDDVFFLVRKCVRRSLSSASVDCVCATINNGCALLETQLLVHLQSIVLAGYPAVGFAAEALQTAQTALLGGGKDAERQREMFVTALNDLRAAAETTRALSKSLVQECDKQLQSQSAVEKAKLEHSLAQFEDVARRFDTSATHAVHALTAAAVRPRLKTCCEQYISLSHELSEEELRELEAVDRFVSDLNANIDRILASLEPLLHKDNYQELLSSVCTEVSEQWSRVILKCSFNRLGAIQLDKEFRELTSYLSMIAGWTAREKCMKLSQLVSMLNVESVEESRELFEQLAGGRGGVSAADFRRALALRGDLDREAVNTLSLS